MLYPTFALLNSPGLPPGGSRSIRTLRQLPKARATVSFHSVGESLTRWGWSKVSCTAPSKRDSFTAVTLSWYSAVAGSHLPPDWSSMVVGVALGWDFRSRR